MARRRATRGLSTPPGRLSRRAHAAPRGAVHPGPGRPGAQLRACVRLRPQRLPLGVHRSRVDRGDRAWRQRRPDAPARNRHAPGPGRAGRRGLHEAERRRIGVRRPQLGRGRARRAGRRRRRLAEGLRHRRLLARLAQHGRVPRSPVALPPSARRPHAERAHVRTDRRVDRGAHDVVARDARWRAELGLPLQLGARRDVRPVGALHAGLRLRGEQLLLLHRRSGEGRLAVAGDVRRGRREGPARGDARPSHRL